MKYLNLCFAVLLALTFAACGGHDHDGNDAHNHGNEDDHGHDHDHDDHSGPKHSMGGHDLDGGYRVEVMHIGDIEAGKEVIFEIVVKKDGNAVKDASVTCWIGGEDGKEVSSIATAEWMGDENLYDGHLDMPGTMPEDAHLWVRIRHDGKDMRQEFEAKGHDHDHD